MSTFNEIMSIVNIPDINTIMKEYYDYNVDIEHKRNITQLNLTINILSEQKYRKHHRQEMAECNGFDCYEDYAQSISNEELEGERIRLYWIAWTDALRFNDPYDTDEDE